jgi:hypothetical protein
MPSDSVTPGDIFQCRQCGECCKGFGGTYVNPDDIRAIAEYIGADPGRFAEKYCQKSGSRQVLAQGEDGYCVFRKDKLCSIHPVKPRMCRAWPFIPGVLADPANWRIMANSCPGIRTGFSDEVILRCVKQELYKDDRA